MKKTVLNIDPKKKLSRIAPEIYGQFSEHLGRCIYEGIYVGEDSEIPNIRGIRKDVVEALKELKVPVLRWPGGCYADEYHWRDGIGPKEQRKRKYNTNWGGVVEDNSFGTHEFMDLCGLVGCEPYIAVNVGSGTVQEAAEWVEYLTADGDSDVVRERRKNGRDEPWKVKYLGIGNENWGCGGNMDVSYYASEYKRYQTFCKEYSGNRLYKVACGPSGDDTKWTEGLMDRIGTDHAQGISMHYYTVPDDWEHKGNALDFDERKYYSTLANSLYIEEVIKHHLEVMDKYDPEHKVGLLVDEWGTWYDVEPGTNPGFLYQQNTMRDAIVAACSLNIFNKHSDRIVMANIAQTVNVLQAMLLTEGASLVKTPTYEVFRMFRDHQGAELVESRMDAPKVVCGKIEVPALSESVSVQEKENGSYLTVTLANLSLADEATVELALPEASVFGGDAEISMLHDEVHAHNTFQEPNHVAARNSSEDWSGRNRQEITLPPCSVCRITCPVQEKGV